jgi:predicted nucleotidyltransferase
MEMKPPLNSPILLPAQLRLDGLHDRLAHLNRSITEVPEGLSEDMKERLERAALFRGMNAIQRSCEGVVTTLCLILDGSVADDDEDWYKNAMDQLAGSGSGRVPILPPDLVVLLQQIMVDPDFDPLLERKANLKVQRQRWEAAQRAAPMLVDALGTLDALLADGTLRTGYSPDPEYAAQHASRQKRAAAQGLALKRTLTKIEKAFRERGYSVIPFGSLMEGRTHGRSDLDLVMPDEVPRDVRRLLSDVAEEIARAEGVACDLHFSAIYDPEFLDRIKVIRNDQITHLRDLIAAAADPKTHED